MRLAMKIGWPLCAAIVGAVFSAVVMHASSGVQAFVWGVATGLLIASIAYSYGQRREKGRSSTSAAVSTRAAARGWDGAP